MWIVVIIVVIVFLVGRAVYRADGHYQVIDEKGMPVYTGTYKDCVEALNSYKGMEWGQGYKIKRMKF